jgi:tripartite-type tricarboxylate transporter receptor subunit TctC
MKAGNIKTIIVGIILSIMSMTVFAAQQVKVYWPFGATSPQGMMVRELIDNMNRQQNKYQFIFYHKLGAGGSIAASAMLSDKSLAILVSSSSFYIRPLLFKDSHDVTKFSITNSICMGQPVGILSKNKNLFQDAKSKEVTIAINPGSITTLTVRAIKKDNPDLKIVEIPFKSGPESMLNMMGGHVDAIGLVMTGADVTATKTTGVHILGFTGVEAQPGVQTFNRQGIKGLEEIVTDYHVFVNKNMSSELQKELHDIINNANIGKVKIQCENDFGYIKYTPLAETENVHLQNQKKWKELTADVEKE